MIKENNNPKQGFTIIEVVLVLAIAGLIFLMVFIALPALQRSQRDTQRRDDMARVSTAINQYQSNNSGQLPKIENDNNGAGVDITTGSGASASTSKASNFVVNYLGGGEFVDPDGEYYIMNFSKYSKDQTLTGDVDHIVYVVEQAVCDGEKVVKGDHTRDYAIQYRLEGSGTYCKDNR